MQSCIDYIDPYNENVIEIDICHNSQLMLGVNLLLLLLIIKIVIIIICEFRLLVFYCSFSM